MLYIFKVLVIYCLKLTISKLIYVHIKVKNKTVLLKFVVVDQYWELKYSSPHTQNMRMKKKREEEKIITTEKSSTNEITAPGWGRVLPITAYRIYSINRPGRFLNFWT